MSKLNRHENRWEGNTTERAGGLGECVSNESGPVCRREKEKKRATDRGTLMGTFANFSISGATFPWNPIFESYPEIAIEIERAVPFGTPVYYCWLSGQTHRQASEELCGFLDASAATVADTLSDRTLIRIEKPKLETEFFRIVEEAEALVLSFTGRRTGWSVTLHFPDNDTVSLFHEQCYDHGISAQLQTIYRTDPSDRTSLYGLTPEQFETLRMAHRLGYFEIPRQTTTSELAEEFGISSQAVSERLRRALTALVASTLVDEDESNSPNT